MIKPLSVHAGGIRRSPYIQARLVPPTTNSHYRSSAFPASSRMSVNEAKPTPHGKKGKSKEKKPKSGGGGGHKAQIERLKVVVRRLPPNLPEDVFWQSVQQWVTEETVTWRTYYKGKFKTR